MSPAKIKIHIWLYLDGKMGHEKQCESLVNALAKLIEVKIYRIKPYIFYKKIFFFLFSWLDKKKSLPRPDFLIGAGHQTHLQLILDKKKYGGQTVLIMRPSLPIDFFDLCLIPTHDLKKNLANVIETFGPINDLKFYKNKQKNEGLILLGGISRHFEWNTEKIIKNIIQILSENEKINFTIMSSRRTPKNFIPELKSKLTKPIAVVEPDISQPKEILNKMKLAQNIWVTEDSLSMIYESISVGALVNCINLDIKTKKIRLITNQLFKNKTINFFNKKHKNLNFKHLITSEADRCAKLLIKFFEIK